MSTDENFDIGDLVKLQGTFTKTSDGSVQDPTTVTCTVKLPDGTKVTYVYGVDANLIRDSKGVYYVSYLTTMEGTHWYGFFGTGDVDATKELSFYVNPRRTA